MQARLHSLNRDFQRAHIGWCSVSAGASRYARRTRGYARGDRVAVYQRKVPMGQGACERANAIKGKLLRSRMDNVGIILSKVYKSYQFFAFLILDLYV